MDLQKVNQLLDAYFEGKTSVKEEKWLQNYFLNNTVPAHLEIYRDMFSYFASQKKEKLSTEMPVNNPDSYRGKPNRKKWYGIAAILVVVLGVTYFIEQNVNTLSPQEQQEAQMAYEKTKEALNYISIHFNESTASLSHIDEFSDTTNKIFK